MVRNIFIKKLNEIKERQVKTSVVSCALKKKLTLGKHEDRFCGYR